MAFLRFTLCLALFAGALANSLEVKPIEKVISLLEDMEKEVRLDAKNEAIAYRKFACFCKSKTMKRSQSVKDLNDKIELKSSDIADKTQTKTDDLADLTKRKANQEKMTVDLAKHNARCAKDKAIYEAQNADLTKAVGSLRRAIKAMQDTGGSAAASLLAVKRSVLSVSVSVERISLQENLAALSKVDPEDAQYQYHSNDIVNLCKSLLEDFKGQHDELNSEWTKTDNSCKSTRESLNEELASNKRNMNKLDQKIEGLAAAIAGSREDLVQAVADLKDDELYLKDLTARCEERANDYDQRSKMRNGELQALKSALEVLTNEVQSRDDEVNKRALLLQNDAATKDTEVAKASSEVSSFSVSFLQGTLTKQQAHKFLARTTNDLTLEAKKTRALSFLKGEGRRIGSMAISALASRVAADPFKKVKGLIQKLIERLLAESAAEATKKGFCDESIASAEHARNSRFEEANDLSREIANLEAKRDELSEEIDTLKKDIKSETDDLKEATDDRDKERADNEKAISVAKDGLAAVNDALLTLRSFYSNAAKAAAFTQASPVDEDTAGAGFSGSYQGKQGSMKAVFALLEVIQSDFDRTIRKTEQAENKSHRAYVAMSQASKSSIAGKTTKKELDEQDLESTETKIKRKMADMQDTTDLLDKALQELEELKPTCIDTGMSYEARVKKRETEMKALKTALCILDTDGVEAKCK